MRSRPCAVTYRVELALSRGFDLFRRHYSRDKTGHPLEFSDELYRIPYPSDVQFIIQTDFREQAPQTVEDQGDPSHRLGDAEGARRERCAGVLVFSV